MRGQSWSVDYQDVGGAVNIYGLDSTQPPIRKCVARREYSSDYLQVTRVDSHARTSIPGSIWFETTTSGSRTTRTPSPRTFPSSKVAGFHLGEQIHSTMIAWLNTIPHLQTSTIRMYVDIRRQLGPSAHNFDLEYRPADNTFKSLYGLGWNKLGPL